MRITETEQSIRRERMLHAAYDLFSEHGIDHVSFEKIAYAANVSPNSIFRYFTSKADILEQTQTILWDKLVDCITSDNQQARDQAANGFEEMRVLLDGFVRLYQTDGQYLLFAYEYKAYLLRKRLKLSEAAYQRTLKPVRKVFSHALQRGQADGSITIARPVSQQFLIVWGIMRYFVEQMLIHGCIYEGENPWDDMFPLVVEKILENLRP